MKKLLLTILATLLIAGIAACADEPSEEMVDTPSDHIIADSDETELPEEDEQSEEEEQTGQDETSQQSGLPQQISPGTQHPVIVSGDLPQDYVSAVFVEHSDGTDDGVIRLIASMEQYGIHFYRTSDTPDGLVGAGDVVLLQINVQWAERGGTNTDLIGSVIRAIINHPDGFAGEVIVADNGQAQFGSGGTGGNLNWAQSNARDTSRSTQIVINEFREQGYHVTGVLWDEFTTVQVEEFSMGDMRDGFVVGDYIHPTGLEVTYPKFTTEFGTHVSFRYGIFYADTGAYSPDRLRVINMPVLKSHMIFNQTGTVKGYMGTVSDRLTNARAHHSVGTGGMGTQMVETRMPVLNIMDMIWVAPDRGPSAPFDRAVEINQIAASTDPVAIDVWTTRHILIPEAERIPGGRAAAMDPAGTEPGTFGHWLRLSLDEMLHAGFRFTMSEEEIFVVNNAR